MQLLRARCVSELAGMLSRDGQQPVSLGSMRDVIIAGATESVK